LEESVSTAFASLSTTYSSPFEPVTVVVLSDAVEEALLPPPHPAITTDIAAHKIAAAALFFILLLLLASNLQTVAAGVFREKELFPKKKTGSSRKEIIPAAVKSSQHIRLHDTFK
jgi:hypothetical protein